MKKIKIFISISLAVLLVFALLPVGALQAYAEEPEDTALYGDAGEAGEENPAGGNDAETPAEPDPEYADESDGVTAAEPAEEVEKAEGTEQPEGSGAEEDQLRAAPSADYGIPVLTLTIDAEEFQKVCDSEDHTYRAKGGSIRIDVPEGYRGDYFDSLDSATVGTEIDLEYFRGRGNSTWEQEKKPFKFKLDKKTSLLGMDKDKHWILMANYFDITQMKNRLTSYIATKLGLEYMAQYSPVEFYVNDEYMGCYMLCHDAEKKVGGKELKPADITEPEVTGKYMLARFCCMTRKEA